MVRLDKRVWPHVLANNVVASIGDDDLIASHVDERKLVSCIEDGDTVDGAAHVSGKSECEAALTTVRKTDQVARLAVLNVHG